MSPGSGWSPRADGARGTKRDLRVSDLEHAFKATVFARERRYRLTGDALEWDDGEKHGAIALRDVVRVRVFRQPGGGMGPTMRRTIVHARDGGKVLLASNHYVSLGHIEDRADTYRPFVAALVERVAARNPQAVIQVGHHWLLWLTWLVLMVAAIFVTVLAAVIAFKGEAPWQAVIYVPLVLAYIPMALRIVGGSRPRRVDPHAMPAGTFD